MTPISNVLLTWFRVWDFFMNPEYFHFPEAEKRFFKFLDFFCWAWNNFILIFKDIFLYEIVDCKWLERHGRSRLTKLKKPVDWRNWRRASCRMPASSTRHGGVVLHRQAAPPRRQTSRGNGDHQPPAPPRRLLLLGWIASGGALAAACQPPPSDPFPCLRRPALPRAPRPLHHLRTTALSFPTR